MAKALTLSNDAAQIKLWRERLNMLCSSAAESKAALIGAKRSHDSKDSGDKESEDAAPPSKRLKATAADNDKDVKSSGTFRFVATLHLFVADVCFVCCHFRSIYFFRRFLRFFFRLCRRRLHSSDEFQSQANR